MDEKFLHTPHWTSKQPDMSGFRLLDLVKVFLPILPEIELPVENVTLDEKIVYTLAGGIIFLFCQFPLFGIVSDYYLKIEDPLYFARGVLAMDKGTLLELGLLPVITSAFIWQVAAGLKLVNVNFSLRSDRELFQSGQKLTSFALAVVYGLCLICSGYYDNVIRGANPSLDVSAPISTKILLFIQIVGMSFFITLLVELFDKGYAFGSGIISLLALQACTNFAKDIVGLDLIALPGVDRSESFGVLINFLKHFSLNFKKMMAEASNNIFRPQLPNAMQVTISFVTILVLIAIQNFRIEISIRSTKVRGMASIYPIKLLYTGALPLLFSVSIIANLHILGYFFAKALEHRSPLFSSIIGTWGFDNTSYNLVLKSGILYFLSPSNNLAASLISPIRASCYTLSILLLSTWFGSIWCYISGASPKDIAKQFKDQGLSIAGKRDLTIAKELSRVIPVASVSGAFIVAALAAIGEYMGGLGKGITAIVGMSCAFGILEDFMYEYQQTGGNSQFSNAFGRS